MNDNSNIFGCYVSITTGYSTDPIAKIENAKNEGEIFRSYIWGNNGINNILAKIEREKYGNDVQLILFEFYINPLQIQLEKLKEIGNYRKKEKAIGCSIVINQENFFSKNESQRVMLIKQSILNRLESLSKRIKSNKLNLDLNRLIQDTIIVLNTWNKANS